MTLDFKLGDKVRISNDYSGAWFQNEVGVISRCCNPVTESYHFVVKFDRKIGPTHSDSGRDSDYRSYKFVTKDLILFKKPKSGFAKWISSK